MRETGRRRGALTFDKPAATQKRASQIYFCEGLVRTRKTRSSTGTLRVRMVGAAALATPTARAELEMAGPAGLLCREVVSPGITEMRVVLGEQEAVAPKQVSRTKIWR